jgi:hypothetical protein
MVMRMKLYVFEICISNNTFMKFMIPLICMSAALGVCAQNIHHQMISAQSTSSVTSSGLTVKQSIGQISATGNFSGKFSVQQGYLQSNWAAYLASPKNTVLTSYPNPFTEFINFNLIGSNATKVRVQIFDVNGKSVYLKDHAVENKLVRIALSRLAIGAYLVKIKDENRNYFTKIIKN